MNYDIIEQVGGGVPRIAFLTPKIALKPIRQYYVDPHLSGLGQDIMVCDLYLEPGKKKTPVKMIKEYLEDLMPHLNDAGIELLVVNQPDYFKVLTKQAKTDPTIGDVMPSIYPGVDVTYVPNYGRVFYDPEKMLPRIERAMDAVVRWTKGDTKVTGSDIIKFCEYPQTNTEIISWLDKLLEMDCDLTCDIEGFSLKHYDAGIGTITFCWNKHHGVAFPVDYVSTVEYDENGKQTNVVGKQVFNPVIRAALKHFFQRFFKRMIYHNISYDVYVLVYQLFMKDILDQEGMLEGLDVLLRNWECTQLISYLATNSCSGNELGLKIQAQEFAGNYAQSDIHDITLIPMDKLLEYNLVDGLATWFVHDKNYPIMMADNQNEIYQGLFKDAVVDIIQMQLTGMPMNMEKVKALDVKLNSESDGLFDRMNKLSIVQSFMDTLKQEKVDEKNAKLKTKQIGIEDLGKTKDTIVEFNPNSPPQLQRLLFSSDFLDLPVLDLTDSKLPSTGAETLEKLLNHTKDPEIILFLELLIEFKALAIILSTFLPAFLRAKEGPDGWHYLFGNFRLGGTASGRLSSNNPNLQNIPSSGSSKAKARLAKMIKECFEAPPGWLFVGLDFDSLEDKISAVTTRDPEKIKVYSDGYDGHCLRAQAYFGEHMPDIELAPETAVTYKAIIDGQEVYFHSEEEIEYQGESMTGADLVILLNM